MKAQCPHCQSKFKAGEGHEGKTVLCPKCGEAFKVVSIAAAEEPSYPGIPAGSEKGLYRVSPLLGVFIAGGMIIVGMIVDEPFSNVGFGFLCVGLGGALIGIFTFFGLRALITGSWEPGGKLDQRRMSFTGLGGVALGILVIALLRWEEIRHEWIVAWFGTNTAVKIVLLLVNIPAYILVARRVSPSFRKILAGGLSQFPHRHEIFHTLVFVVIYLAQYLLIKIIFLR
ncbi:MAG: hypothetical protein JSW23_01770 [Planctomycetota bacterium]|nr:MAG: hypothetical protein JSW23_01770 [Planctomycetota bacterium]